MSFDWKSAPLDDPRKRVQPQAQPSVLPAWAAAPIDDAPPVREVVRQAVKVKPEAAAEADRLARRYPAPYEMVKRNADDFQMFDIAERVSDELSQAPHLTAAFRNNPRVAELAHDDVPTLAKIERAIGGATRYVFGAPGADGSLAGDVAVTALKSAVGLPQAVVGLANIPTFGYAGKGVEALGIRFKEAQGFLDEQYSGGVRGARRAVSEADGFLNTLAELLANPSAIATGVGESLASMLGGAAVGRGILAALPHVAPWLAAALGEGVIAAGSAAEKNTGRDTGRSGDFETELRRRNVGCRHRLVCRPGR